MCTGIRFNSKNNEMYFGRNLDWTMGYGQKVVITPREFSYPSAFLGDQSPQYGAIIGMAIVEDDTPLYFDCANEAGLAIAGLNFPGYSAYEEYAVDGKTNVAAYEFPLWVTMNFSSVNEVEEALKNTAIVAKPINDKFPVSELHYLIGDRERSIVVEYTKNGMEIHHNDTDILTNQPGFGWHMENLRNYMNLSPKRPADVKWEKTKLIPLGSGSMMRGIPGDYYSPSRFVRVAYLNNHYPVKDNEDENVSRLFHTLTGVAMIDGGALMDETNYEKTIYTGGYSTASKTYYYSTYENPAIVHVSLGDYDLDKADLITV
ncbi:choloylglycine hydrolase [Candidatus Saccharibacteria bacterium]|nr:choloylglycine hydrolase [Candidatus Saccharibacteria bacterium]